MNNIYNELPSTSKNNFDNEDFRVHYSEDDILSKFDSHQTDEDSNYDDSHCGGSMSSSNDSCEDSLSDQTIGQDDNIPKNNEGGNPKKQVNGREILLNI